ncbi:hypothetical protein LJC48_01270 [Desulfovibrio sp. OttesenSCG-928-C06]|nr:hypothetical protein [Desulfovibrio sp. OttesenSCG-928-C06]
MQSRTGKTSREHRAGLEAHRKPNANEENAQDKSAAKQTHAENAQDKSAAKQTHAENAQHKK